MDVVVAALKQDVPYLYAKINVLVVGLDVSLFWLNGSVYSNTLAWMLFSIEALRLWLAQVLFTGVKRCSAFRCKVFCIGEATLMVLAMLSLSVRTMTTAGVMWFSVVIVLRICGIWLIIRFIHKIKNNFVRQVVAELSYNILEEPANNQEGVEAFAV